MKRFLKSASSLLLCLALLAMGCCATAEDVKLDLDEDAMLDYMVEEFEKIAQIPRGSGNTDAISDYLYGWGEEHGFPSMQDEVGNVRWDVAATPGYEGVPLTVLQAHMDMVVVSDDGRDMTQSPIVVVVDKEANTISSDGHTSLGSDDGMGIVTAMYLVTTDEYVHGPLRVIITINEEGGSPSGVGNMDPAWVTDAKYLVNIDSEDYATCTVAACGFMSYRYDVPLTSESPSEDKIAYTIDLNGAKGGHSGVDIDKNRANAIKAVDYCLAWAKYNGIDVQIASFTGGTGMTAIPALASATVVFSPEYEDAFKAEMDQTIALFAQQYDRTEAGYSFTYAPAELPETVLTADCSATVIDLVAALETASIPSASAMPVSPRPPSTSARSTSSRARRALPCRWRCAAAPAGPSCCRTCSSWRSAMPSASKSMPAARIRSIPTTSTSAGKSARAIPSRRCTSRPLIPIPATSA